jgi:hypothetical protein
MSLAVAGGIGGDERAVADVGVAVVRLGVERGHDQRVGREEAREDGVVHAAAHVDEVGVEAGGVAGEADAEQGELVGGQRGGPVLARAGLARGVVGDGVVDVAGLVGDDVGRAEVEALLGSLSCMFKGTA